MADDSGNYGGLAALWSTFLVRANSTLLDQKRGAVAAPLSSIALGPSWQVHLRARALLLSCRAVRAYFLPRIWVSSHAASCWKRAAAGTAPAYPARIPLESRETARYVHPGCTDGVVCVAKEPAS